jgi:hypothetical protein
VSLRLLAPLLCVTGCRALLGIEPPVLATVEDADVAGSDAVDGPPPNFRLRIQSRIDGRSQLIVHRDTVQWQHFETAAPGRELGANDPTLLDDVAWFPVWPDIPDAENRDCNCFSSKTTISKSVPTFSSTTTLTEIQAHAEHRAAPDAANDYTLVIEMNDLGVTNSSIVIVEVAVEID